MLIAWTIRAALMLLWLAWWQEIRGQAPRAKKFYVAGWLVYVAHVAAAFHFEHHWNHSEAVRHTAEASLRVTGVAAGFGIYFNHLFTLVWLYVAVSSSTERLRIRRAAQAYLLFMVVQGAVVFAPPLVAVVAAAMLVALGVDWWRRRGVLSDGQTMSGP